MKKTQIHFFGNHFLEKIYDQGEFGSSTACAMAAAIDYMKDIKMLTWNDVAKKIENMTPEQRAKNVISSAEDFRMILSKICKDAYQAVLDRVLTIEELFTLLERVNSFRMSLIMVDKNDLIMPIESVYGNILVGRLEKSVKSGDKVKIVTRLGIYSSVINKIHMYAKTYDHGLEGSVLGLELENIDADIRNGDKLYLES